MTRRTFLAAAAASAARADTTAVFPAEWRRYPDPATEFEVLRLTDSSRDSYLPRPYNRAISRRGHFLIYTTDRGSGRTLERMDLKSGQSREIAREGGGGGGILETSPTLSADEKTAYYVAQDGVYTASLNGGKTHRVYTMPDGASASGGFSVSDDSLNAFLIERASSGRYRLLVIPLRGGPAVTAVESPDPLSDPIPRPRRAGVLYRHGSEIWLVNYDGAQNRRLRLAASGDPGQASWSPEGRQVVYLNFPGDHTQLTSIREATPDTNEDRQVAATSQFVSFGLNGDGSVIAGASGSKASPYVLLMVRSVRRELTLCEHRAADPALVCPVFAPDSRRVYFQSDRHGKLAIYSINVERLVTETEVAGGPDADKE
jgi:oligogalacturonide lyase